MSSSDSDDPTGSSESTLAEILARRRNARALKAKSGRIASSLDDEETPLFSDKERNVLRQKQGLLKSRPRELSSSRPVPVGREACIGIQRVEDRTKRTVRHFDPRFEDHCGDLLDMHVERNYEFLAHQREERRKELEQNIERGNKVLKKNKVRSVSGKMNLEEELDQSQKELQKIEQGDLRRNAILRQREVLQKVREEEKEAVRKGKNPFFLKRKELRRLELRAQFDDIKKRKGGVKKFIAKRRRKIVGKERKNMAETNQQ